MPLKRPICKYGSTCYQTNPDHLKKYSHPELQKHGDTASKQNNESSTEESEPKVRKIDMPDKSTDAEVVDVPNVNDFIASHFYLHTPSDFHDLYEFCTSISSTFPLEVFVKECGLELVGPYHLLSHKQVEVPKEFIWTNYYRCYHDPPELVTVIAAVGTKHKHPKGFHLGYFRDTPTQTPFIVASGSLETGALDCLGGNLFAALLPFVENSSLGKKLREFAEKKGYSLQKTSPEIKKREKSVVCRTFHTLGLVVPVTKDDVGYRPLPASKKELTTMLEKIVSCDDEQARLRAYAPLDELITLVQFANDEGDFGEGLELGLDLLAFHPKSGNLATCDSFNSQINHLLSLGYELASRDEFGVVVKRHMESRSHNPGCKLIKGKLDA